jgi:hypothetical protein
MKPGCRWVQLMILVVCLPVQAQQSLKKLEDLANADRNGKIIEIPVIVATPRTVFMQIEKTVVGQNATTNTSLRTVTTTRTNEENITDEGSWEQTIKRDASARISANASNAGNNFSASGTAGYEETATTRRSHRSVRNEISKDKDDLEALRSEIQTTLTSFAGNSGRFYSSVALRNSSVVPGWVSNMRVTLYAQTPGGPKQVLDSFYACSVNDSKKDFAQPSDVPEPDTCLIPIPGYDPRKPTIEIPITFFNFNTGRIFDLLGQDLWIEVDPLSIGIKTENGIEIRQAANVARNLQTYSLSFTLIRPDGTSLDYHYLTKDAVAPATALRAIFKNRIVISKDGTRIEGLERWKSAVKDWEDPSRYRTVDLDHGAWIWTVDNPSNSLNTPALPGESFRLMFLRKRDLLIEEPPYVFQSYYAAPDVFWPNLKDRRSEASCGIDTVNTRRVLVGDRVTISFLVQQKKYNAAALDLDKYGEPFYKPIFSHYKAIEYVPTPSAQVSSVESADLLKYGVKLKIAPRSSRKDISEWARLNYSMLRRTDDGYVIVNFTVSEDMLIERRGELCIEFEPEKQTLALGRNFTILTPNGNIATVPGGYENFPDIRNWKDANPIKNVELDVPSFAHITLTINRLPRTSDSLDVTRRDRDLDWFISSTCKQMIDHFRSFRPDFASMENCPLDEKLPKCLLDAQPSSMALGAPIRPLNPVSPFIPIPAPPAHSLNVDPQILANAMKNQSILQACQNRRARAVFIAGCTGGGLQFRDRYCETRASSAPMR